MFVSCLICQIFVTILNIKTVKSMVYILSELHMIIFAWFWLDDKKKIT
jgi:hypothetical protein